MKKIALFIIFLFASLYANAQTPAFQWVKTIRMGMCDAAVAINNGNSIALDGAGNVYSIGYFEKKVDFDSASSISSLVADSSTVFDTFILKLDPSGNFIWAKNIGGASSSDYAIGQSIALDATGNVCVAGRFGGTVDLDPGVGISNLTSVSGSQNIFILKLDGSGNFVWAKNMGGDGSCFPYSIALDAMGNIYTAGGFCGTADFDPGVGIFNLTSSGGIGSMYHDIFILKLDSSGNFAWAKRMGDVLDDWATSITVDASGNVFTTGTFQGTVDFDPGLGVVDVPTTSGNYDIFVSKLDSSGNFLWADDMGGSANAVGNSIALDPMGNVYTSGWFLGTIDFDPGIGDFYLSTFDQDMFISKLDGSGNFLWAKSMEGTTVISNKSIANSISIDAVGNVYATGQFQGTVDFNPASGTSGLTALGCPAMFIEKINASGNFVWVKAIDGISAYTIGSSITIGPMNNLYTLGYFYGTTDFDPGSGTYNILTGPDEVFVHKMSIAANDGVNEFTSESNISIYPNPSNGIFSVEISSSEKNSTIEIYNGIGDLVYSKQNATAQMLVDLNDQANGLYFVKIRSENKIIGMKKIIKD